MDQIYNNIINMSNKDAAQVLKHISSMFMPGRGCGKTIMLCKINVALSKAIKALENTPD